jgi:hypothetical protein
LLYIGDYDKFEYDIELHDGTVVENCYPNADKFCSLTDHGAYFKSKEVKFIRFSFKPVIKNGGTVGIIDCKDPEYIVEWLRKYGVKVSYKPMTKTQPPRAIYNLDSIEGEIIGIEYGDIVQTGYIFFAELNKEE